MTTRIDLAPAFDYLFEVSRDVPDDGLTKFLEDAGCGVDVVVLREEARQRDLLFAKRLTGARSTAPTASDEPFTKRARGRREVTTRSDGGRCVTWFDAKGDIRKFRTYDPGEVVPEEE